MLLNERRREERRGEERHPGGGGGGGVRFWTGKDQIATLGSKHHHIYIIMTASKAGNLPGASGAEEATLTGRSHHLGRDRGAADPVRIATWAQGEQFGIPKRRLLQVCAFNHSCWSSIQRKPLAGMWMRTTAPCRCKPCDTQPVNSDKACFHEWGRMDPNDACR